MNIIRRSAGLATVLLSVLGLLLCIAGAVGVWAVKGRVDRVAAAMFTAADDAFEFMTTRLMLVHQRLDSGRERMDGLAARAERLKTLETEAEIRAEAESLRWTLDLLLSELKVTEGWLDSIEAVARGVQSAAASVAESRQAAATAPANSLGGEPAGVTALNVAELAGDLADALNRLEVLRVKLLEMRENRILVREFAAAMIAEAAELDSRIVNLSTKIDDFNMRVTDARASSADAGQRVHRWISFGAVMLTLVALWVGLSQVCMMKHAWWCARRPIQGDSAPLSR